MGLRSSGAQPLGSFCGSGSSVAGPHVSARRARLRAQGMYCGGRGRLKARCARPALSCTDVHSRPLLTHGPPALATGGGAAGGVSKEFKWLKDTRWHWNNWRDVIFRADGSFLAPAEGCEREGNPKCRWSADDDNIYVTFGGAGTHTLTATPDQTTISGQRDKDGDPCSATRVQ